MCLTERNIIKKIRQVFRHVRRVFAKCCVVFDRQSVRHGYRSDEAGRRVCASEVKTANADFPFRFFIMD